VGELVVTPGVVAVVPTQRRRQLLVRGVEGAQSGIIVVEGVAGDVLFGLSTSGNSKNVLNAIKVAKEKGMKVIAMTGKDGGAMAGLADVEIRVPHFRYADRTQEIHIKVIHILMMLIEFEMAKVA